ncbi:MAG: cell division protein FtsZ [Paludibacteraceae bacterium]|nr:cell division protein FtsZ [Paludibacteraceae bacterium]
MINVCEDIIIQPDLPDSNPIVKIVGVGGCGGNVVQHVYDLHVEDVSFAVCNTDRKALRNSSVPVKIQLGNGLGAGGNPEVGLRIAEDSLDELRDLFSDGTEMAFVTAGFGKGTGTGAGPYVAQVSKSRGVLTVGFVCLPPDIEGETKMELAKKGVEQMRKSADAIVLVDTQRIFDLYSDLPINASFDKADDLMADAAKAMADIVTKSGRINIDMADVRTVLQDSGDVVMAYGKASGKDRARTALQSALNSPLLLQSQLSGAKDMLLNIITSPSHSLMTKELNEIQDYLRNEKGVDKKTNLVMGLMDDDSLGEDLSVTIVATGLRPEIREHVPLESKSNSGKKRSAPSEPTHVPLFDLGDMTEEEMNVPAYGRLNDF